MCSRMIAMTAIVVLSFACVADLHHAAAQSATTVAPNVPPSDAMSRSQDSITKLNELFEQSLKRIKERNEALTAKREALPKIGDDIDQSLKDLDALHKEAGPGSNLANNLDALRKYAEDEGAAAAKAANPNVRKYTDDWQLQAERSKAAQVALGQLEQALGDQMRALSSRKDELTQLEKLQRIKEMNDIAEQSLGDLTKVLDATKAKVQQMGVDLQKPAS